MLSTSIAILKFALTIMVIKQENVSRYTNFYNRVFWNQYLVRKYCITLFSIHYWFLQSRKTIFGNLFFYNHFVQLNLITDGAIRMQREQYSEQQTTKRCFVREFGQWWFPEGNNYISAPSSSWRITIPCSTMWWWRLRLRSSSSGMSTLSYQFFGQISFDKSWWNHI